MSEVKKEKQELQIVEQQDSSPMALISQALDKGLAVDTISKLMDLKDRWDAKKAKESFDEAMAAFQGECPVIEKKKEGGRTKSGAVAYKYAPLETIVSQVKKLIQKHGFSYAVKLEMSPEHVKAICIVKHKDGHSESSEMLVPLGTRTEIMSAPQVVAATSTFAKRYAFCNAFGIMTGDGDNDAAVKVNQVKTVVDLSAYETQIRSVKSITELQEVWKSIPVAHQKALEPLKNEVKAMYGGPVV